MREYLPAAVASVDKQSYTNIELIIVDDGSDKPISRQQYSVSNIDISFFEISHNGKPKAVNKGFEEANGEYIVILDADDELPTNSIEHRLNQLKAKSDDLCIGSFQTQYRGQIQEKRSVGHYHHCSKEQLIFHLLANIKSPFHQNAMMFHRDLTIRAGKMDSTMIRGQDKDYAIRLIQSSNNFVLTNKSVYIYNRYDRPVHLRINNRFTGFKYLVRVIQKHFSGFKRFGLLAWVGSLESLKLIYNLFAVYKR